jgi:hypothetical protein
LRDQPRIASTGVSIGISSLPLAPSSSSPIRWAGASWQLRHGRVHAAASSHVTRSSPAR